MRHLVLIAVLIGCGGSPPPTAPEAPLPVTDPNNLLNPTRSQLLVPRATLDSSLVFSEDLAHHAR